MSLPWFRMYTDFLRDPKMLSLAFEDQRHFVAILALKSDGVLDSGASGTMLDRMVAQFIWVDFSAIQEVKRRLVGAGLIGDDWQPVAWEKRQYASDSSKGRVRKFRENKKKQSETETADTSVTCNGLGNVTCNGDETDDVTKCNGTDTDTDTDTDTERDPPPTTRARATDFATPSGQDPKPAANTPDPADPAWVRAELERPAAQPAAATQPAFAMHADWEPDHAAMGERCQGSGIPPGIDPGLLIEFRSYWAGEGIALRQTQWEHKLFRQLIHAHRAACANPDPIPGAPHATSRRPRAATAADIDFADTSWLDERTIERCRSALDQHGV